VVEPHTKVPRRVSRGILLIAVTGIALAVAELATRIIDGYRINSFRLEISRDRLWPAASESGSVSGKWRGDVDALPYIGQLPIASGVNPAWFATPRPAHVVRQPDADLEARARRYRDVTDQRPNYEWNLKFVVGAVCRDNQHEGAEVFKKFDDIYVFDPTDAMESPTYRFLSEATYPSGLRTNVFGWRGPDIAVTKPPGTVRIAFVGASTTIGPHDAPMSYPELVGVWLNRWAETHHPGISFEVINAGREGVNSKSIQAIVRKELLPVEPDLVVYYEGSNQFWPADFIWTPLPPRSRVSGPQPSTLASYSAIARRVERVVRRAVAPGFEPPKPPLIVNWPHDLDERDPDLTHPHLPIELPHILADLELMRGGLEQGGADLVMTSFVWLVHPGLVLDPGRDAMLYDYLNISYWPYTYAHMRRFVDFENRVFRKYASLHHLDFIDVASAYPRDPRLFDDAIHMANGGVRLQAWIMFNGLVPVIERRLASHEWPRPARRSLSAHPEFSGRRRLVPMTEVRAACTGRADRLGSEGAVQRGGTADPDRE
jgi:hypothetical protein